MTSSKPEPAVSRPIPAQRPSSGTGPMNVPARNGTPRQHSHSFSLGALNGSHRVARRKSMSKDFAGMAAAVQNMDEASLEALVTPDGRVASGTHAGFHRAGSNSTIRPGSSPHVTMAYQGPPNAAGVTSGTPIPEEKPGKSKPGPKGSKARRASEGAYLSKSERKRTSGEIRCETCGKGYKHSSCLTKHLWEHTPQWQVTSKLLISKHQQVQMLEAASVLVTMIQDPVVTDASKAVDDSDRSSASPMPSGSSAVQEDSISLISESTPPPIEEEDEEDDMEYIVEGQPIASKDHHRYSSTSSIFSQSYQSGASYAGSVPTATSYSSFSHFGPTVRRPSTSGTTYSAILGEDETKLAAAVENVSFGTPKTGATHLHRDIPPVPPLPARYASHKASLSVNSGAFPGFSELNMASGPTPRISDERGSYQFPHSGEDEHRARRSSSRGQSDEHDGVFSMEE